MQRVKIGFVGEGWGAVVAIKSLQQYFDIECFSSDENVIKELIGDYNLIYSFEEFKSEMIICAGYKPLIQQIFVLKHQIINIHYSLLPSYRGLHSNAWAIMNGEIYLGLTIHLINEFIDDGPILHQKKFFNDQISSATYYMEIMNFYILENLGRVIYQYSKGDLIPEEQDKNNASWVGKRGLEHNLINFNKGFEYCKRLFRVLQHPYPYPQIKYKDQFYTVAKIKFHESKIETDLSRILNIDEQGIWVKILDGYIVLDEIRDMSGNLIKNKIFKIGNYLND
jgi:methionyl-tRNA formyltransferase